jgi:hypothetical protein
MTKTERINRATLMMSVIESLQAAVEQAQFARQALASLGQETSGNEVADAIAILEEELGAAHVTHAAWLKAGK